MRGSFHPLSCLFVSARFSSFVRWDGREEASRPTCAPKRLRGESAHSSWDLRFAGIGSSRTGWSEVERSRMRSRAPLEPTGQVWSDGSQGGLVLRSWVAWLFGAAGRPRFALPTLESGRVSRAMPSCSFRRSFEASSNKEIEPTRSNKPYKSMGCGRLISNVRLANQAVRLSATPLRS